MTTRSDRKISPCFSCTQRFRAEPREQCAPFSRRSIGGFTLIELMIVLSIMGILLTIAQPSLKHSLIRAREAVLKDDLFKMRDAIDQYYADNDQYPEELSALVNTEDWSKSYLRGIPKDPFTGAADWITVAPEGEESGVFDVHSASPLIGRDGTAYNTW